MSYLEIAHFCIIIPEYEDISYDTQYQSRANHLEFYKMTMLSLLLHNLITIPMIVFFLGLSISIFEINRFFFPKLQTFTKYFLLFCIGLKGGSVFLQHASFNLFSLLVVMVIWGLIQPIFSYGLLKKFTSIDSQTAAVVAACFGSVSLMTFAAGVNFLEKLQISYDSLVVPILALMEIPAIFTGLFLARWNKLNIQDPKESVFLHIFLNKTIVVLFLGMGLGLIFYNFGLTDISQNILILFKPCLYCFLFFMGLAIGKQKKELLQFSRSLTLFGCYMPLIGGIFGIFISWMFNLSVGTGTLLAILSASASYIAVPAAMKDIIPEAKEAIYMPLTIAIAFPFNILVGIPLYYCLALKFLCK